MNAENRNRRIYAKVEDIFLWIQDEKSMFEEYKDILTIDDVA